jgi:hypothetical protein
MIDHSLSDAKITRSVRLGLLCLIVAGWIGANCDLVRAQSAGAPAAQTTADTAENAVAAGKFRYNDRKTTPFGPAYADIWLKQSNFLACKPPLGRKFTYGLCFYSGPAVGTPVPADGSAAVNPPLPCILSPDGKSADCTCYGLSTEQYPPYVPYFVDINAILNLDLYLRTIGVCGHGGENCSPRQPIRAGSAWNEAPICRATNAGRVIPGSELTSVFSSVKSGDYATGASPNSTSCTTGKYAGCMTAPCRRIGNKDSAGKELLQCQCPVYDGPFEIGQAGVPCDANDLTPPAAASKSTVPPPVYVWSAAHNPKLNHGPINPPTGGCLPDAPDGKGCPLYSPEQYYPVAKGSPLCRKVCDAYRSGIRQSPRQPASTASTGIQIGYTCDAALCTTIGIGQTAPPPRDPIGKAALLKKACGGLAELSGLRAILALEQIDQVSCGASQVCGCDEPGPDINPETQAGIAGLNRGQEAIGIAPQCLLNGTLCGAQK